MDIFAFLSGFIYRIRYKLFFGTIITVVVVGILTGYIPKQYNVTTTLFTGITSKTSIDNMSGSNSDWNASNNAHDNIINLVKSRSVLEMVSVNLIAQDLIHGDLNAIESKYISADNYRKLLVIAKDVLPLVDKSSHENTVNNLLKYKEDSKHNFIFAVLNWKHKHYSYDALSKIKAVRKGSSDMIEISYQCDDPGIAANTIEFLNKELATRYEFLLLNTSNDVVKHFEQQLVLSREKLNLSEDALVEFNIKNKIINYEEQTKHLAALNNSFESRYEEILLSYQSSYALLKELESQMDTRTSLVKENEIFLNALTDISKLNGEIAEIEIFGGDSDKNELLTDRRKELQASENQIKDITKNIDLYKFSKKGIVISEMVTEWLSALLKYEKSKAELVIMEKRKADIEHQYETYSPVGPNLGRQERDVKVNEEEYLTILHHLGLAKLKHKNILMESGALQVVTPPEFPLIAMSRKRELYVVLALICSIIFITAYYLIIELLDRTISNGIRAQYLTGGKVVGAFPSKNRHRHRRYNDESQRIAISYLANILNGQMQAGKPLIINVLSITDGEGKSHISQALEQCWKDRGFNVSYINYHNDFDNQSKQFMQLASIYDIIHESAKSDVIIVEYASLQHNSVPMALLKEATTNLLILDAQRLWGNSDKSIFDNLKNSISGNDNVLIYLNNVERQYVEQYTGMLPPYTYLRKLGYKIFNFGITAKS